MHYIRLLLSLAQSYTIGFLAQLDIAYRMCVIAPGVILQALLSWYTSGAGGYEERSETE